MVNAKVEGNLQSSAPTDIQQLLPHLESRGQELATEARQKLKERGQAEAKAMKQILETQHKHLKKLLAERAKEDDRQLRLRFGEVEEEIRQLKADEKFWKARLPKLEAELDSEPARIQEVYDVKAQRIEPVGLVYLWPVTG